MPTKKEEEVLKVLLEIKGDLVAGVRSLQGGIIDGTPQAGLAKLYNELGILINTMESSKLPREFPIQTATTSLVHGVPSNPVPVQQDPNVQKALKILDGIQKRINNHFGDNKIIEGTPEATLESFLDEVNKAIVKMDPTRPMMDRVIENAVQSQVVYKRSTVKSEQPNYTRHTVSSKAKIRGPGSKNS